MSTETRTAEERAREIADKAIADRACCAELPACQTDAWNAWLTNAIAAALREVERETWRAAAEVAEAYADENRQMASDTIALDPFLSGKSRALEAVAKSQELQIQGCIHSSMFHAAQNIAAACRQRAEEV